jgi:hypothetical protein
MGEVLGMRKITKSIVILAALTLAVILLFSGCVCPLFSIFERSTGLKISAGENIDESAVVDELIYPGSVALVQVTGDIEKIVDLVATYGVSFSDEEKQALEGLPESITEQDVGAIVYSTPDSRSMVLAYYDRLVEKGWQIESFRGPMGNSQDSDIVMAVKGDRRQALMVTGSENNSFIIFIDFSWEVFENGE